MRCRGFEIVSSYQGQGIELPRRQTSSSAGYDLAAAKDADILPGQISFVPTGLKAYMPYDEVLKLYIRSSLAAKRHLALVNSVAIIDADYYNNPTNEGHMIIAVINFGAEVVHLAKGERLAQGIFERYLLADGDDLAESGESQRRQGGFGSTDL